MCTVIVFIQITLDLIPGMLRARGRRCAKRIMVILTVIVLMIILDKMIGLIIGYVQLTGGRTIHIKFPNPQSIVHTGADLSQKCHQTMEGTVNVHIVPHSYNDVGWTKTYMQYFTGNTQHMSMSDLYLAEGQQDTGSKGSECARCILDTVIPVLKSDSQLRFMYVEMAFFSLWFEEQNKDMQDDVRMLVRQGRLEFVAGGWCSSDTATTYYDDIIDQHTLGFQWIEKEFGSYAMPKSAWHIEQFGHSREHSSIFAQFGFDGLIIGRIDNQEHAWRMKTRNMQTIWRASPDNLGYKAELFTSVLFNGSFTPEEFGEFRSTYTTKPRAKLYKTRHILIPIGEEFVWDSAHMTFYYLSSVIKENNKKTNISKVHMLYSTPTCYINAVNNENMTFKSTTTDYLPYGIPPNTFGTGFYTSRPALKRHVKVASSLLQTCKILSVLAELPNAYKKIKPLKEAVAILQHHHAITGVQQQYVTDDYNEMLAKGEQSCQLVISAAYDKLYATTPMHHFCPLLDISFCNFTEHNCNFTVEIFNPLGWPVRHWIRLPVQSGNYRVENNNGEVVDNEVFPISERTKSIPERNTSIGDYELVFRSSLPPVGFSLYHVTCTPGNIEPIEDEKAATDNHATISNKYLSLTVNLKTGLAQTFKNLVSAVHVDLRQHFIYYVGSDGQRRTPGEDRKDNKRASGAYAFVPMDGMEALEIKYSQTMHAKVRVVKGRTVQEIHQQFSPWVSQVLRLYPGEPYLEMEWTVGPIPDSRKLSKEIISRFDTSLNTGQVWYADSNGREMVPRIRNSRESFKFNVTCPISSNFYPVTARMCLKDVDKNSQLTILVDRSQAGSSQGNGQMDLLIHRRTFYDDDFGVNEALNETGIDGKGLIVRGKHYLLLDTIVHSPTDYRPLGLQIHHFPTVSFTSTDMCKGSTVRNSYLKKQLPMSIHLLTLDKMERNPKTLLLRLEHCFEYEENGVATILQLNDHFHGITSVIELSLGANYNITEVKRLRWKMASGVRRPGKIGSKGAVSKHKYPYTITLRPMEIRTFYISVRPF